MRLREQVNYINATFALYFNGSLRYHPSCSSVHPQRLSLVRFILAVCAPFVLNYLSLLRSKDVKRPRHGTIVAFMKAKGGLKISFFAFS